MKWNCIYSIPLFRLLFLSIIHEHKGNFKILFEFQFINKLQERFRMICWMGINYGYWYLISLMHCERIWRIKLLFWHFVNTTYLNCNKSFHCLDYQIQIGLSNVFVHKIMQLEQIKIRNCIRPINSVAVWYFEAIGIDIMDFVHYESAKRDI